MHEKDIVEILRKQVLLKCNDDITFLHRHNGRGACHTVKLNWFENIEAVMVQHVVCSDNPNVYWNDKEISRLRSTVCLVQICSDMMASTMKRGAIVMYTMQLCC